jgi:hypothetical protein
VVAITAERGVRVYFPELASTAVTLYMVILLRVLGCVLPQGYLMAMCGFKGPAQW